MRAARRFFAVRKYLSYKRRMTVKFHRYYVVLFVFKSC